MISLTEKFNKFLKWTYRDKDTCCLAVREDAPNEIKVEAKIVDEDYFKRTGRHMLQIDY